MYQHPITAKKFESREEYVQALIESYIRIKQNKFQLASDETAVVEAMDKMAEAMEPGLSRGTIKIDGVTQVVKVGRKVNIKYKKARREEHPLRKLLTVFPELIPMIRVAYEESGSAIQALMDRHAKGDYRLDDDSELATELAKVRVTTPAKPTISVEDRLDVPQSSGSSEGSPTF